MRKYPGEQFKKFKDLPRNGAVLGAIQDGRYYGYFCGCMYRCHFRFISNFKVKTKYKIHTNSNEICTFITLLRIFRRGHGGNGFFPTVGKIMLQSGASFGLFMGIGSLVRCDDIKVENVKSQILD